LNTISVSRPWLQKSPSVLKELRSIHTSTEIFVHKWGLSVCIFHLNYKCPRTTGNPSDSETY
jgi:hypothetical protein